MRTTTSSTTRRRPLVGGALAALLLLAATEAGAAEPPPQAAGPAPAADAPAAALLTDPYLQLPTDDSVNVAWVTEWEGSLHAVLVGEGVDRIEPHHLRAATRGRVSRALLVKHLGRRGIDVEVAGTAPLSQTREDARSQVAGRTYDAVTPRPLWRHEATVDRLEQGERVPYRVVSVTHDREVVLSDTFTLAPSPAPGTPQQLLLTSDHQLKAMTPANMQLVEETVGRVDGVLMAGDLVNVPDRASEWFDDARGFSFFPAMQGRADHELTRGDATSRWQGGEILQHAPLLPTVGNHEVMGRRGVGGLDDEFNQPVPRDVAARHVAPGEVEASSWNLDTYEELFTVPDDSPGGERYYATTVGDVRVISLFATRIWRTPNADADARGAFREATDTLGDEMAQGWGRFVFEPITPGSEQYEWLVDELASPEFRDAEHTVVMLHHPVHTLGDNAVPPFTDPVRYEETGPDGEPSFVRYEYPADADHLLTHVAPLLEGAGVDLVLNGHSHVWNRFEGPGGVDYLETSNVGNTYGAFHPLSGRERTVPPGAPWDLANYATQGDPGGLEPVVPTEQPVLDADGTPLPFLASNDVTAFSVLDTGTGTVTTWAADLTRPDEPPTVLDRFTIGG